MILMQKRSASFYIVVVAIITLPYIGYLSQNDVFVFYITSTLLDLFENLAICTNFEAKQ